MKSQNSRLPQIGKLLEDSRFATLNTESVKKIARAVMEELRGSNDAVEIDYEKIIFTILQRYKRLSAPSIRPLINATGIVVHTNLGRAPLSKEALEYAFNCAKGYCNLEFDLKNGKRGDRYGHLTGIAQFVFGCEDMLLVNNNAAAVFLILNTFAKKKECVVSRGELVEIGGGFRIPEVMANSGAKLVEIGTTNKSRIADYENAIGNNTKILLKVHRSNFAISGFTEEASYGQIVELAKSRGLIDYYDLGSACLVDFGEKWSQSESNLFEIMALNPSIVSFSADKLFGSLQAGIILGSKELIEKLKKNQLLRMLRCDKITVALVEQTLLQYAFKDRREIPTVKMLSYTINELHTIATQMLSTIQNHEMLEIRETRGFVGGGTLPQESFASVAICINSKEKPERIIKTLRDRGVIARIEDDKVCLDLRCMTDEDRASLTTILNEILI